MKPHLKITGSHFGKLKPSDILENELKKKELEFNFVKEVFEQETDIKLTKSNLEDLNIIPKLKSNLEKKPKNPKEFLEKAEKNKIRKEEREKLKMLEKLEAQVLGKKPKLNSLGKVSGSNFNITNTNSNFSIRENEGHSNQLQNINNSKRLIDNINQVKGQSSSNLISNTVKNIAEKKEEINSMRKTFIKEKIEIDCEKSSNSINPLCNKNNQSNLLRFNIKNEENLDKEFFSSLSQDKKKFFLFKTREVYDFLKSIYLIRHIEFFIEDGIEDLECILDIDEDYFKERDYSKEHQVRIMNKIKEIQSEKKTNNDIINSKTEVSNSLYFVKSSSNNQISQEDFYDEEEQSRLFKEAVENFRQGVEIDDQTYKLNKNKDFKSVTHELGTSPDILNCNTSMLPTNKERSCCWNCLKIILSEESIKHRFEEKIMKLKTFCSDECFQTYNNKIYTKCDQCSFRMEKGSGKYFNELWFCKETCLEKYIELNQEILLNEPEISREIIEYNSEANYQEKKSYESNSLDDEDNYDPMTDF